MDLHKYLKYICHRKPERSFFIHGHQFPVCSRCTGIYSSILVFLVYAYFFPIHYTQFYLYIAVILVLPCLIDGLTQLLHYRESNNTLRFITGYMAGTAAMIIYQMQYLIYFQYLFIAAIITLLLIQRYMKYKKDKNRIILPNNSQTPQKNPTTTHPKNIKETLTIKNIYIADTKTRNTTNYALLKPQKKKYLIKLDQDNYNKIIKITKNKPVNKKINIKLGTPINIENTTIYEHNTIYNKNWETI